MHALTVHLDRLAHALDAKGIKLKRTDLLDVAAKAFGYHNQNEATAASKRGELDPPFAVALGRFADGDGRALIALEDPSAGLPYAIAAERLDDRDRAARFGVSPYGSLLDLSAAADAAPGLTNLDSRRHPLPANAMEAGDPHGEAADWIARNCMAIRQDNGDLDYSLGAMIAAYEAGKAAAAPAAATRSKATLHTTLVHHKHGVDLYAALDTAEHDRQLAAYCRDNWSTEVEDRRLKPEKLSDAELIDAYFKALESQGAEEYRENRELPVRLPAGTARDTGFLLETAFDPGSHPEIDVENSRLRAFIDDRAMAERAWQILSELDHNCRITDLSSGQIIIDDFARDAADRQRNHAIDEACRTGGDKRETAEVPDPQMLASIHGGIWGEHAYFPRQDWRYEVDNNDTSLGYWDWVRGRLEQVDMEASSAGNVDLSIAIRQQARPVMLVVNGTTKWSAATPGLFEYLGLTGSIDPDGRFHPLTADEKPFVAPRSIDLEDGCKISFQHAVVYGDRKLAMPVLEIPCNWHGLSGPALAIKVEELQEKLATRLRRMSGSVMFHPAPKPNPYWYGSLLLAVPFESIAAFRGLDGWIDFLSRLLETPVVEDTGRG